MSKQEKKAKICSTLPSRPKQGKAAAENVLVSNNSSSYATKDSEDSEDSEEEEGMEDELKWLEETLVEIVM
jgi:hypothetical protein